MAKFLHSLKIIPQLGSKDLAKLFRDFLIKESGELCLDFEKLVPMPPNIKAMMDRWRNPSDDLETLVLKEEDTKRWQSQHGMSDQLIWVLKHWGCLGPCAVEITPDGLRTTAVNGVAEPIISKLSMKLGVPLRVVWCDLTDDVCGFYDADISGGITGEGFTMQETPAWILDALGYSNTVQNHHCETETLRDE